MKTNFKIFSKMRATLLITLTLSITIFADTSKVVLKNGVEIKAEIVKKTEDNVFLDLGSNIIAVAQKDILEIIKDSDTTSTLTFEREDRLSTPSLYILSNKKVSDKTPSQIMEESMESVVIVSNPGGLGAGFIIKKKGYVITNHHVVRGEQFNTITVFIKKNGETEKKKFEDVELVAFSALLDIALLKIKPEDLGDIKLRTIPISKPGSLHVGDSVFAIGNPGVGSSVMTQTVSEGIVSYVNRNFTDVLYVQTTAAVNPGNSGGPLLNKNGAVIGLVTLKAFFQEGIAFALPVEYILLFLDNYKSFLLSRENPNMGYRYLKPE